MACVVLNDVDDSLIERLQRRVAANGRTVEEEHLVILEEALGKAEPDADFWAHAGRLRSELKGRSFPDTTALIRQMRDERAGLVAEQPE